MSLRSATVCRLLFSSFLLLAIGSFFVWSIFATGKGDFYTWVGALFPLCVGVIIGGYSIRVALTWEAGASTLYQKDKS